MTDKPAAAPFRITPGFAIPFAHAEHPAPAQLNAALRTLFLEREAAGEQYRNADPSMNIRPGLFESRFDLFEWPDAPVVDLRRFCWAALFKAVGELNSFTPAELNTLEVRSDAWFHITRRGGYFGQHNHPMASWSGVYCVDAGNDRSGHPESGALVFSHPCAIGSAFVDSTNAKIKGPWGIRPLAYRLTPGQIVIFPSWLMHQVMPFQGDGERITVAFNAWFRKKQ
jgi:hypothetical protein